LNKTDERAMFASWDSIYRGVRDQKLASGVATRAAVDSTDLHRTNVIFALTREHATIHTIVPTAAQS
jgi:hypothetical protein